MGPGFGGINLGGFALPDLNMDEINAGIAVEVAKYLADQDLSAATNEYEKDVAENTKEQITEYESGIASLPPVVEEVMQALSLPDEYKIIEAVSDRDFPTFVEPSAPMPSSIQETVKAALDKAAEEAPAPITPVETITEAPASTASFPSFSADITMDDLLGLSSTDTYNPNYMSGEDERAIGRANESDLPITGGIGSLPSTAPVTSTVGQYTDIQRMPDVDPNFRRMPVASPISDLIKQQRAAYNSALQNAVYNPQPQQQQTYFRPMSAAEFGSRPGQEPSTDLGFMSMMGGGALNSGLGGLPPMQQNDKLTQLFAQSFRPRR
tara:strand:+ start:542 stop:1510 length:969 start_codon:yes stop_codon:yes gene_type:complete